MVATISSSVASSPSAATGSEMISVARGPMAWTPSISPYFASATTLINPSCSPRIVALLFARNGNFPVLTSIPASRACCSVRPMQPICGSQYVQAGQRFLSNGCTSFPAMRQLRQSRDNVTDRVHERLRRFQVRVHMHIPTLDLRFRLLKAQILSQWPAPNADEDLFGRNRLRFCVLVLEADRRTFGILLHRFNFSACFDSDSLFLKRLLKLGGDLFVFQWNNPRQHFENRDFAPEGSENRGELDAHGSGAHHNKRFRNRIELQDFAIRQNCASVNFDARQRPRV